MTATNRSSISTLAASVAPEDVNVGDDVAVLNEASEYASFLWDDALTSSPEDVIRVWWRPTEAGMPLKVKAVCLPFVFVTAPTGVSRTMDLRQVQLVRLSRTYARTVRRRLKSLRKPNAKQVKKRNKK